MNTGPTEQMKALLPSETVTSVSKDRVVFHRATVSGGRIRIGESLDVFLDAEKNMKKRCPKCRKGKTCMVSSDEKGWLLGCSACGYKAQSGDGTLTGAVRRWNDDRY